MTPAPTKLYLAGHLDVSRYPEFRTALHALPPAGPVLLDLRDVEGVDSTFLSELMIAVRHRAGKVAVVLGSANVAKVFAATNLDLRLHIVFDFDDALAYLAD